MDFQGLHQCPHPVSDCSIHLTCQTHFLDSNLEEDVSVLVPQLKNYLHMGVWKSGKRQQQISVWKFHISKTQHKAIFLTTMRMHSYSSFQEYNIVIWHCHDIEIESKGQVQHHNADFDGKRRQNHGNCDREVVWLCFYCQEIQQENLSFKMKDIRFLHQWCWRFESSGVSHWIDWWVVTNIFKNFSVFIYMNKQSHK